MSEANIQLDTAEEALKILRDLIMTPQLIDLDFHFMIHKEDGFIPIADYKITRAVLKEEKE